MTNPQNLNPTYRRFYLKQIKEGSSPKEAMQTTKIKARLDVERIKKSNNKPTKTINNHPMEFMAMGGNPIWRWI